MFLDTEVTPELEKALRQQFIIIAHSPEELFSKLGSRELPRNLDFAISEIDALVRRGEKNSKPNWSTLKNKRVLDLASGSGCTEYWYPHFSRLCAINGADVIAVDIQPQTGFDQRLFRSLRLDLVEAALSIGLPNLPELQGYAFDIIHSANFIGGNSLPGLEVQVKRFGVSQLHFEKVFFDQAVSMLAEGGIVSVGFIKNHGPMMHTKDQGQLVEVT